MAAANGASAAPLEAQLAGAPQRFEFFQAVRLLLLDAARRDGAPFPIGSDNPPEREPVRFAAHRSAAFPKAAIESGDGRAMLVNFMGLTGPQGVLPQHFTSLLIELQRANDNALSNFHDVFNHRLISLFHRAWEKYRFAITYERSRAAGAEADDFTRCLAATAGFALDAVRNRLSVDDELFVHFAGHFARGPRCASALESVLVAYFQSPVRIESFVGQWLDVDPRTAPPLGGDGDDAPRLGFNALVGTRVWDVQSRFRVRIGPLGYAAYLDFLPGGAALRRLAQIVRSYVGAALDFDVQLSLRGEEAPECRLGGQDGARLGWTSFMRSGPLTAAVDAASFAFETISAEVPGIAA